MAAQQKGKREWQWKTGSTWDGNLDHLADHRLVNPAIKSINAGTAALPACLFFSEA